MTSIMNHEKRIMIMMTTMKMIIHPISWDWSPSDEISGQKGEDTRGTIMQINGNDKYDQNYIIQINDIDDKAI